MARILVVGSGASGVHFTLTALRRGHTVTMLDVGYPRADPPAPEATFEALKEELEDPAAYFLGPDGQGVVYPGGTSFFGHPPSKHYVFKHAPDLRVRTDGMSPLFTFARGGFAEAWTGGCYPFSADDLKDYPLTYDDLHPHYAEVARRIGIGGTRDDLESFMPFDVDYQGSLPLDPHSRYLLERYAKHRDHLHRSPGFWLGRSRVATLSEEHNGRPACSELGRCLWGCPTQSLWAPSVTLRECHEFEGFRYVSGELVRYFEYDSDGIVSSVSTVPVGEGSGVPATSYSADAVVLAAGTLGSSRIVLESLARRTGGTYRMPGLMDNRQVHMPFLTPALIGAEPNLASYQFHHLAFAVRSSRAVGDVHGQITALKSASLHPILTAMPTGARSALDLFRRVRTALGIANINLHDSRRVESHLGLEYDADGGSRLVVCYKPDHDELHRRRMAIRRVRRALLRLGAVAVPGLTRTLPMGASVHYSGTMPMSTAPAGMSVDPSCRSHTFPNLFVIDGSVLPSLPAKNLTFTLMANAVRVATVAF